MLCARRLNHRAPPPRRRARSEEVSEGLDLPQLRGRCRELLRRYRTEVSANEQLVAKLQLLQNAVMKRNSAEGKLRALSGAHRAQAAQVVQLRQDNAKLQKYTHARTHARTAAHILMSS
jgi:hypothetical protein